jgi:hypothetical protein
MSHYQLLRMTQLRAARQLVRYLERSASVNSQERFTPALHRVGLLVTVLRQRRNKITVCSCTPDCVSIHDVPCTGSPLPLSPPPYLLHLRVFCRGFC